MKPLLGVSIGATHVRAVLCWHGAIRWAGAAPYESADDLADAIGRLAGDAGMPVRRARVVLERELLQLRTVEPAPPLRGRALARYVALEAPRLFRKNGAALVTDGVRIAVTKTSAALWAGAAPEPLVQAVLDGCVQAGLAVEALGPAADVLPHALVCAEGPIALPNGATTELLEVGIGGVWRSRLVPSKDGQAPSRELTRALAALGDDASYFAAAYAATIARPRLALLPVEARAAQERRSRRRLLKLIAIGAALWLLAAGTYVGRLAWIRHAATQSLGAAAPSVDSALAMRRELGLAEATLATVAGARQQRSRHLELLSAVTQALGDSTYLVALQVTPDSTVRLAGYAPVAARAVAVLQRVALLRDVRLEGPVTREHGAGSTERDRFAVVARMEDQP